MPRNTVIFTISLPPAMAAELEQMQKEERRTRSEIVHEALRCYMASQALFPSPHEPR